MASACPMRSDLHDAGGKETLQEDVAMAAFVLLFSSGG